MAQRARCHPPLIQLLWVLTVFSAIARTVLSPRTGAWLVWVQYIKFMKLMLLGSVTKLVEHWPATCCVVGLIPAGGALEIWQWTLVLNCLVG